MDVDVRGRRLQTGEDRALCEGGVAAEGEPEAWAPEDCSLGKPGGHGVTGRTQEA